MRVPKCIYSAADDDFGLLLDVTTDGLGNAWHNLWLPLLVETVCDAQIQFEVLYDSYLTTQISAAIADVTVINNGCLGAYRKYEKLLKNDCIGLVCNTKLESI